METNQERGIKLYAKQSLHTTTRFTVLGFSYTQKEVDFVEKSNKKYKTTADKKRREKLFEEEDMIMMYSEEKKFLKESLPSNYI